MRPQRAHADIVVSFRPGAGEQPEHLDAEVILRDTLRHPDLSPLVGPDGRGPTLVRREQESVLRIPGDTHPELAAELEEAVWQRMQYASHLRVQRLGEFMVGTELRHSESLALAQTLLLYHLVSTRAEIGAGIDPHELHVPGASGSDSRCTPRPGQPAAQGAARRGDCTYSVNAVDRLGGGPAPSRRRTRSARAGRRGGGSSRAGRARARAGRRRATGARARARCARRS